MNIDKSAVIGIFREYVSGYNPDNIMIRQKIDHSYRVAGFSRQIAGSIGLSEPDINTAWLIGILHDIGRFEQVRQFGTFKDSDSVDHADLGANILFKDGIIRDFFAAVIGRDEEKYEAARIIETAVRFHNKLSIPDSLDKKETIFCKIVRDADKTDIFRVLTEIPEEEREIGFKTDTKEQGANENIMRCVYEHRCVPREYPVSMFDVHMAHCCMAFDLNYRKTVELVRNQGYIDVLLNMENENTKAGEQLMILKNELNTVWKSLRGEVTVNILQGGEYK